MADTNERLIELIGVGETDP